MRAEIKRSWTLGLLSSAEWMDLKGLSYSELINVILEGPVLSAISFAALIAKLAGNVKARFK